MLQMIPGWVIPAGSALFAGLVCILWYNADGRYIKRAEFLEQVAVRDAEIKKLESKLKELEGEIRDLIKEHSESNTTNWKEMRKALHELGNSVNAHLMAIKTELALLQGFQKGLQAQA